MKMKHSLGHLSLPALLGLAGWACVCPLPSQAVTTNVSITSSFTFSPATVTINAGDTVKWTWNSTPHSTTSSPGDAVTWDSGTSVPLGGTFSVTFPSASTNPYICTLHAVTFNMKGSVIVQAVANSRPSVVITNPPNNAVRSAPATITLEAEAQDLDGTITNIQFFQGAASLGNVTSSPYSVVVNNLGSGDYTFSAVASDNGGLTGTNSILVHVVTPVPIVLSAAQRLSATSFQFNYSANQGLRYVVLRSGALPGFSPISTNTAASGTVTFTDNNATGAVNFYRVQLAPNP
jgi:plastocyanin